MAFHVLIGLPAEPARAWVGSLLVTYWGHALVWATVVALLVRCRSFAPSVQHVLWKVALLAPLGSALLATTAPALAPPICELKLSGFDHETNSRSASLTAHDAAPAAHGRMLPELLFVGVFGVSGLGLVRFGCSLLLFSRRLRGRTVVRAATVLERFERLRRGLGLGPIVLSESANIDSPMVIGLREVCLPYGLLSALPEAELDAVLAHELAHLQRADAVWFPLVSLLCALFWMQPVNRVLSSRFRRTAELACDDTAAELIQDRTVLACALLHVAELSSLPARYGLVPTIRGSSRALVARVARLMLPPPQAGLRLRPWANASLALVVLGTASLNVRLATARTAPLGVDTLGKADELADRSPDLVSQNARMAELLGREQALKDQLEAALHTTCAECEASVGSVRVLELEQALSHLRASESWLEQRFESDWASWEKRKLASASRVR